MESLGIGSASAIGAERARAELSARLEANRPKIERAVLTRVQALSDSNETADADYAEGLRMAVSAAVGYGIEVVERGEERAPSIPPALLAQARLAARNRVGLDTVLRRYFAGHSLLADFLVKEAERDNLLAGGALRHLLRSQAALFERLAAAVSEEHSRESEAHNRSSERRHVERIERLLAGELLDTSALAYDFDVQHLGLIAAGPRALDAIRELAGALDRRLMAIPREEDTVWAWLGGRRASDPGELRHWLSDKLTPGLHLALGEPGKGLDGWRFTHRQAKAALLVALRGSERCVRYADVALLAAILQDDLLATSLRELYLKPLESERDGGEAARRTLRAYFAAGRNVSSAAKALGVDRGTVSSRLRTIESIVGSVAADWSPEFVTALRLSDLRQPWVSSEKLAAE